MSTDPGDQSTHLADPDITQPSDNQTSATTSAPPLVSRTVRHSLFDYTRLRTVIRTVDGRQQEVEEPYVATALRGEVIEVNAGDLKRGERHGAFVADDHDIVGQPAPTPAAPTTPDVTGGSDPAVLPVVDGGRLGPVDPGVIAPVPPRPKTVAPKGTWIDYAIAHGMARAEAEELTKDELIAKYPPV